MTPVPAETLTDIQRSITARVGEMVRVRSRTGRGQLVVYEGVLDCTYPSIFTVLVPAPGSGQRRLAFSYNDVLMAAVELQPLGGSNPHHP